MLDSAAPPAIKSNDDEDEGREKGERRKSIDAVIGEPYSIKGQRDFDVETRNH